MEPKAGDILDGKYRLLHRIGQGAMASVFAAEHVLLRQIVAVKMLLPIFDDDRNVRARFFREARAASRVGGEFVPQIFDVGELPDGSPYLVMEKLDGETLAERRVRLGRLPVTEVADLLLQAMDALARAHVIGIVHRDLKPENLFVARSRDQKERVKLLDFGMARVKSNTEKSLTGTGTVLGSLSYMSPEHCRGGTHVVPQSDVWSLAVTAFELTSGELPFQVHHPMELFTKVTREDAPSLLDVLPGVDPRWAEVIRVGLARELSDRYPSMLEFAIAVAPFASSDLRLTILPRIEATFATKIESLIDEDEFDDDAETAGIVISGIADTILFQVEVPPSIGEDTTATHRHTPLRPQTHSRESTPPQSAPAYRGEDAFPGAERTLVLTSSSRPPPPPSLGSSSLGSPSLPAAPRPSTPVPASRPPRPQFAKRSMVYVVAVASVLLGVMVGVFVYRAVSARDPNDVGSPSATAHIAPPPPSSAASETPPVPSGTPRGKPTPRLPSQGHPAHPTTPHPSSRSHPR